MLEVSVVIPAYNAMPYLPQTVESLLMQTFDDFEVIIRKYPGSCSTHWKRMAKGCPKVLEKAFASAPLEVAHLKHRSYAHTHLCLAWKVLQGKQQNYQRDYKLALSFWRKFQCCDHLK